MREVFNIFRLFLLRADILIQYIFEYLLVAILQIFLKISGLKIESLRSIPSNGNPEKNQKKFPENVFGKLEPKMALTKVLD
jgi:hypothetical protein